MYKVFTLAFLLFPHVASAHGWHEHVDASWMHSIIHSSEGFAVVILLMLLGYALYRTYKIFRITK